MPQVFMRWCEMRAAASVLRFQVRCCRGQRSFTRPCWFRILPLLIYLRCKPLLRQGRQLAAANSELPTAQPAAPAAPGPRYSGAGIIQRSSITADGVPGYMLMSPDGRLLAYLEPAPGIDLSQAQNRAWGIIGDRSFRDQLQSDVIVVRGFQPVVLRTGPAPQ